MIGHPASSLAARSDSRFVTLSRYADFEGLTVGFGRTPQGTRITVDDPDKGRASGLRITDGGH